MAHWIKAEWKEKKMEMQYKTMRRDKIQLIRDANEDEKGRWQMKRT